MQNNPKRSEIPEEFTWDLSDIFATDEAWAAENEALKTMPEQFMAFKGSLGRDAETLLAYFRLEDEASVRMTKLVGYANCKSDQAFLKSILSNTFG